jgi:uncharacterized protein (TIGR02145 family)
MLTNGNNIIEIDGYTLMPPKRNVNLIQTTGGTISATPLQGYDGEVVTLSNTPTGTNHFMGYKVNGATLYDANKFKFDKSDVNVSGIFSPFDYVYWGDDSTYRYRWMTSNLAIDDGGSGIIKQAITVNGVNFGTQYYYNYRAMRRIINANGWDGGHQAKNVWKVPSRVEINACLYMGNNYYTDLNSKVLKSTSGWNDGKNGTNESGVNLIPMGHYSPLSSNNSQLLLRGLGEYSQLWTSSSAGQSGSTYYSYISEIGTSDSITVLKDNNIRTSDDNDYYYPIRLIYVEER